MTLCYPITVTSSTTVTLAAEIKFHPEGQTARNRTAEQCLSVAQDHDEMGCLDPIYYWAVIQMDTGQSLTSHQPDVYIQSYTLFHMHH